MPPNMRFSILSTIREESERLSSRMSSFFSSFGDASLSTPTPAPQTGVSSAHEQDPLLLRAKSNDDDNNASFLSVSRSNSKLEEEEHEQDNDDDSNNHKKTHMCSHDTLRSRGNLLVAALLYGSLALIEQQQQQHGSTTTTAAAILTLRGWGTLACFIGPVAYAYHAATYHYCAALRPSWTEWLWTTTASSNHHNNGSNNGGRFLQAMELAVWHGLAQAALLWAVHHLSSSSSSWLLLGNRHQLWTQCSILWTPWIAWKLANNVLSVPALAACGVSFLGLVLLSMDDDVPWSNALFQQQQQDDDDDDDDEDHTWTLIVIMVAGSFAWSMYLCRLQVMASSSTALLLQAEKNLYLAGGYTLWWMWQTLFYYTDLTTLDAYNLTTIAAAVDDDDNDNYNIHAPVDAASSWWQVALLWGYASAAVATADVLQTIGQAAVPTAVEANLWWNHQALLVAGWPSFVHGSLLGVVVGGLCLVGAAVGVSLL